MATKSELHPALHLPPLSSHFFGGGGKKKAISGCQSRITPPPTLMFVYPKLPRMPCPHQLAIIVTLGKRSVTFPIYQVSVRMSPTPENPFCFDLSLLCSESTLSSLISLDSSEYLLIIHYVLCSVLCTGSVLGPIWCCHYAHVPHLGKGGLREVKTQAMHHLKRWVKPAAMPKWKIGEVKSWAVSSKVSLKGGEGNEGAR